MFFSYVELQLGPLLDTVSITDLGYKYGKHITLCMKIRAFWTVKTFIELKLDFVCEGIISSRYLNKHT